MATKKPKTSAKSAPKAKTTKPKTAAKTALKPVSEAPKTNTVEETKSVKEKKPCLKGFFARKYEEKESILTVFRMKAGSACPPANAFWYICDKVEWATCTIARFFSMGVQGLIEGCAASVSI